jgi:hypothetical protein
MHKVNAREIPPELRRCVTLRIETVKASSEPLESKECIDIFVGGLELMNDTAELGIKKRITFPEDFRIFLRFATGFRDVDIRDESICG